MFERVATGWELAQQSWRVLQRDKELLVFPLMSGIACVLVMASFVIPLWTTGFVDDVMAERAANDGGQLRQVLGVAILFVYYFLNYFVIVFFNSALIACAIIRFKGGNPNLRDGFSAATSLLPQIAGWAAVAATVGVVLRVIESRSEKVGQIVAGLMGMAWSAVTYFVVPVIVVERVGPVDAAKRSFGILKKTWGEALTANFGIGFVVFVASLLGVIPIVLGVVAMASGMVPIGIAAIAIGIAILLVVSLISSALNTIIIGALYLYAAEGKVPQEFDEGTFQHAFAHK
jgi:ABC-type multidrug transport system fused ATPase/permease subunit